MTVQKRHQFKSNWPIPDMFMLELGRMTTLWGSLESTITLNIGVLAGYEKMFDSRALILLAHSNFQQRLHMLGSLCEFLLVDYPQLASYESVVKKIEAAQKARNKYAHNSVVFNEETGKMNTSSFSSRGKLKLNTEDVELCHIQEASSKIHEAMCALHALVTTKEMKPLWERDI
ncbi:MAG: hypothetical protein HOP06_07675 [Methylotenera sp.]|nr:hypothetical protein [Methylotenera sp.]